MTGSHDAAATREQKGKLVATNDGGKPKKIEKQGVAARVPAAMTNVGSKPAKKVPAASVRRAFSKEMAASHRHVSFELEGVEAATDQARSKVKATPLGTQQVAPAPLLEIPSSPLTSTSTQSETLDEDEVPPTPKILPPGYALLDDNVATTHAPRRPAKHRCAQVDIADEDDRPPKRPRLRRNAGPPAMQGFVSLKQTVRLLIVP
jgi:hypothetical protein